MLTAEFLKGEFDAGLPYRAYLETGTDEHRANWDAFHERVALTGPQRDLISGFTRSINVLVSSGIWCGDCVQQMPMLEHIERANPDTIRVRFVDRDEHADLAQRVMVCGGLRVPMVVLMNEDFDLCALCGDRTLARYRAMAKARLGPSCPLPGAPVPADEIAATLADWVASFERVHLMLRLSTKLRARHAD